MKKTMLGLGIVTGLFLSACTDKNEEVLNTGIPQTKAAGSTEVVIQWNQEKQEIDGFGVAQAGWSNWLYAHKKRNEVMGMMFGEQGLNLSILRGEVFPSYWENETDKDFNLDDDIDMPLSDPYFDTDIEANDFKRRAQHWVAREAKSTYQTNKLVFAVWSPPAYMKSNGAVSKGNLKSAYYQAYADYLSAFCHAYDSAGMKVYAIAPANEPEFQAEWNSCLWFPAASTLGKFINNNMGPTFAAKNPDIKIVFGENGQWSDYALIMGSKKYVENIIKSYPNIGQYAQIASGHGYPNPITKEDIAIVPYPSAEAKGMKVWMTEVSDAINSLDTSMTDGLKWAKTFHKYLADANTSAIIWWAGALPAGNNEGLIMLNKDRENYVSSKRYETFGNFTRYIKVGSKRIIAEKGSSIPSDVLISSYKKDNSYVVVAVNPTGSEVSTDLVLSNAQAMGNLKRIVTDADHKWAETEEITLNGNNTYSLTIPANSVVTLTGNVQ